MATRLPDEAVTFKGLASLFFMSRQPILYGPAIVGAVAWSVFVLREPMPEATTVTYVVLFAIAPLMGLAFSFLTGLPCFLLWRWLKQAPVARPPLGGEEVVREWRANHYLGSEARGGKLLVTERRLLFVPHRFNFQLTTLELEQAAITGVAWRHLVHPITRAKISSTVAVTTTAGSETFVIAQAEEIAAQLDELRSHGQLRSQER